MVGIRLAIQFARNVRIADDLEVRVAPPSVIAVLKIAAYQDRPFAREKDLEDLGHLLECYVGDDDDRRWRLPESSALELNYEDVAAFLLGRDVGEIVGDVERELVTSFIARLRDEQDPSATLERMLRLGPAAWREDRDALLGHIEAFDRGFGQRPHRNQKFLDA